MGTSPASYEHFQAALETLLNAGFSFDSSNPARLVRRRGIEAHNLKPEVVEELAGSYPQLPDEVGSLSWSILTGEPVDPKFGDDETQKKKCRLIRKEILTSRMREQFFLRQCGKLPRLRTVDWEVALKVAENGIEGEPLFPYTIISIDAISDLHGDHEHCKLSFIAGISSMNELIEKLTTARDRLAHFAGIYESNFIQKSHKGELE